MTSPSPTDGLRLDLDALAELAEAATPGPWKVYDGCSWRRIGTAPTLGRDYDDCAVLYPNIAPDGHPDMHAGRGQDTYANLNYIAALDPQTVLALIDMARRAASPSEETAVAWADPRDIGKAFFSVYGERTALYTTALYASPSPVGMKVKVLDWRVVGEGWQAESALGWFSILPGLEIELQADLYLNGKPVRSFADEDEAKAAAQSDYEARILSALDPGEPK